MRVSKPASGRRRPSDLGRRPGFEAGSSLFVQRKRRRSPFRRPTEGMEVMSLELDYQLEKVTAEKKKWERDNFLNTP